MKKLKRFFIGKPLSNSAANGEKLSILWGVSILSSDALSSVAYALQEIMGVLVPAIGAMAFGFINPLTFIILALIFMVIFSYYKIIGVYSNGGGGYSVVSDNFPRVFSLIGGGALLTSYVLTVSVSIVSGVQQLTTIAPNLLPYSMWLSIGFILLIMWGNLRGISESAKIFGVLPYAFILTLGITIVWGLFQAWTGHIAASHQIVHATVKNSQNALGAFLLLRAFSSGCSSLTGIEAISNTVPHFKKPEIKNARIVLIILGFILGFLFVGVTLLTFTLHVSATESQSLIVLLGQKVFGNSFLYYALSISTLVILIMAANTSYSGFPSLSAVMARDGFLPRQLTQKGDRLAFNNGIVALSVLAIFFVVAFKSLSVLIAIYQIGVFITFTLSQFAFVKHLITKRANYKRWYLTMIPSLIGGTATAVVAVIVSIVRFNEGAWITFVVIAVLIVWMTSIGNHYKDIENKVVLYDNETAAKLIKEGEGKLINEVIVTVSSLNSLSLEAIHYARKIALQNKKEEYKRITVLSVATDEAGYKRQLEDFNDIFKDVEDINYKIIYSEYREVTLPISNYVKQRLQMFKEEEGTEGNVTVVFPQIVEKKAWHKLLHAQMISKLSRDLRKTENVILSIMPKSL